MTRIKRFDYCAHCRKRTEHIKEENKMLCKKCGKISTTINPLNILIPELKKGIKIEKEHINTVGGNMKIVKSIALDHLKEDPKYYTHLMAMERKYKK